ncbi:gamma-glutamylcyclotransferase [Dulcicalothrix desertica PCC 7102]|uniref:glutathione-specific gamma-glutamylcyclotransferase n=1 Tax=Dulcicalothrix desertica PCC 7102 TaxID=232991 RepID=A0A3S1CYU7_9CYAN|nr:gamma-glutamylcyclotransferase [Dulcicalothrix desertica]RUT00552.1 gamma-glutamylcyclotransferase [Dulcicalothrix desertica PCC 7102]TWH53304.1 cation transport protein ChaC [Dulcicalothrix desertica PCC 7102]
MALTRTTLATGYLQKMVQQSPELEAHILTQTELQKSIQQTLQQRLSHDNIWIFAYGSLIWNPILKYSERITGKIYGWHRRFCLRMPVGRGTPEQPGLTLALEKGGSCCGVAYRITKEHLDSELLLLWQREMVVGSYIPRWVKVFADDKELEAIAFTVNRKHPLYAPNLSLVQIAAVVSTAKGELGSCADYLLQTIEGLSGCNITDRNLVMVRSGLKMAPVKIS